MRTARTSGGLFRRALALLLGAALFPALAAGCRRGPDSVRETVFAMDTVMTLTLYAGSQEQARQAMDGAVAEIRAVEGLCAPEDRDSQLYALNHGDGAWVEVPGLQDLLERSLELCRATGGALDVTAYPAVKAWGFFSGEYRVPSQAELAQLAGRIGYEALELSGSRARLPQGMEADLGAVAKGYAGDLLREGLEEAGISSALLDLGQSTIVAMGSKPGGAPWRIALQDPAGGGYLGVLELEDCALGTSGGYQRYFERDGQRYWHILDPDTAAPARSGLASVTVAAPEGILCDGLSTALFVMGLERGVQFWRERTAGLEFEAVFVTDGGELYVTAGLEDSFSLAEGFEDREVTVIRE